MWQLLKAPSKELWFEGQFHIPNEGEKEYRVTKVVIRVFIVFEKNNCSNEKALYNVYLFNELTRY
jgi:hypothetical protein